MGDPIKLYHKSRSDSYQNKAIELISASTGESHEFIKKNKADDVKELALRIKNDSKQVLASQISKLEASPGYGLTSEQLSAMKRGELVALSDNLTDAEKLLEPSQLPAAVVVKPPLTGKPPKLDDQPSLVAPPLPVPPQIKSSKNEVLKEQTAQKEVLVVKPAPVMVSAQPSTKAGGSAIEPSWAKKHLDPQVTISASAGDTEPIFYRQIKADGKTVVDNIAAENLSVGLSLANIPIGKDAANALHIKDKKTQEVLGRFSASANVNINERWKQADRQYDPKDPSKQERGTSSTVAGAMALKYVQPMDVLGKGTKLTVAESYGVTNVLRRDQTNSNIDISLKPLQSSVDLTSPINKDQALGMNVAFVHSQAKTQVHTFGKTEPALAEGVRNTLTAGMTATLSPNFDVGLKLSSDKWRMTNTNGANKGAVSHSDYSTSNIVANYKSSGKLSSRLEAEVKVGLTAGYSSVSRPNSAQDFSGMTTRLELGVNIREPKPKPKPALKTF